MDKANKEFKKGKKVIMLLPARINTVYWRNGVLPWACEIRFIGERVSFGNFHDGLPILLAIVVFDPNQKVNNNITSCGDYTTINWQRYEKVYSVNTSSKS